MWIFIGSQSAAADRTLVLFIFLVRSLNLLQYSFYLNPPSKYQTSNLTY
jgi:hypothetical protein